MRLSRFALRPLLPLAGIATLMAVPVLWMSALAGHFWIGLLVAVLGLFLLLKLWASLTAAQRRAADQESTAQSFRQELQRLRNDQDMHVSDLNLLGRYGNLLLGCTDLAEALQISQQMLSMLLPGSAGTIYPLIDGEGLAEATHLWGIHVGETRSMASAEDCWSMHRKRLHVSHIDSPGSVCPHIHVPEGEDPFAAACIPLIAQGESLGWIYLSAPGGGQVPKLPVAAAAAEQLALALANLKLRQSLRDLSVRDPLTGLFNRRYLTESLGREMARSGRRKLPLAVMAFDLDKFKAYNDTHGHSAGDALLVTFARILRERSRNEDIACRMGGEEFVLILPEMEEAVALRRAEELMQDLRTAVVMHDGVVLPSATTSVGLAMFPEHGKRPEQLLAAADQALYAAKSGGRDRVEVARPA